MKTTSNREIVESFYETVMAIQREREMSTGASDHFRQIFAEDIEWVHPARGGAYRGIETVINDIFIPGLGLWETALDSPRYIEDGDTIVVLGVYRATHIPTGKPVKEPVAHAWYLKDGKVIRFHQYVDTASIKRQMEE